MDYAKIAAQVIEHVGGKDNILSAAHCATRLRLQLKNNDLRNEEALTDVEGVKGVFLTQSQFQIIFGSGLVNLVFAEVQKQIGADGDTEADENRKKADSEQEKGKRGNPLQSFVKLLSDIFVPIIPAIVAGGLLMGIDLRSVSWTVSDSALSSVGRAGICSQHLCQCALYLSAGSDWLQRYEKVRRQSLSGSGYGNDYGTSGFAECL